MEIRKEEAFFKLLSKGKINHEWEIEKRGK